MRLRFALIAIAALSLSSCWWAGPQFYKGDPADAGPIGPGLYKVDALGDDKPGEKIRIVWSPDGSIEGKLFKPRKDDDRASIVMVRFAYPGRDLWITQLANQDEEKTFSYGVSELHGDVLWAIPFIDCDTTEEIVRTAGGEVSGGMAAYNVADPVDDTRGGKPSTTNAPLPEEQPLRTNQICSFKDRASFEHALRAYLATSPEFSARIRFRRIGD